MDEVGAEDEVVVVGRGWGRERGGRTGEGRQDGGEGKEEEGMAEEG